jgi:hypothetical protein
VMASASPTPEASFDRNRAGVKTLKMRPLIMRRPSKVSRP